MKELVIFDVDGTILRGQTQKLFIDYLFKKNIIGCVFYVKLYIWFILYYVGLVNNPEKVMRKAYSFLQKRNISEVSLLVDDFLKIKLSKVFFSEAIEILDSHKKKGREIVLVSNLSDILLVKIASYLDIPQYIGTKLEVLNGKFTGKIEGVIMYGKNKVDTITRITQKNPEVVLWVYTDHVSDALLLDMATYPFAVNPDRALTKIAHKKNWTILYFS